MKKQIVIEIDEEILKSFCKGIYPETYISDALGAIENGTPLPKGHGRLIDADVLRKNDEVTEWLSINPIRTEKNLKMFSELFVKKIDDVPTIIEADKGEE